MPSNNTPLDPFQIAALAGFAKNCNLINSQQFEAIVNSGAKRLDPSIFIVQDVPDWIFYDKVGFQAFKTAIEGTVFNSFFRLIQKDAVFAKKMEKNIFALGNGSLNPNSFKQIIIDEIGDTINSIAVRISNGEQLTGEEIQKLIENGIKAKEDEIKTRGEKVSDPPSTEPTGNRTIFPDLALQQQIKGLRWRPIKGTSLSPKQLQRVQKSTQNIKKQIEKAQSGLRTARAIVGLLRKLESVYSNGLIGIIQSVLKIVFSFVRDIGSSGVYALDMIGPYFTEQFERVTKKGNNAAQNKALTMEKLLESKIKNEKILSTYSHINDDLVKSTPLLSDWIRQTPKDLAAELADGLASGTEMITSIYRPTTYASFIQTIADAFMDDGDVAAYSAWSGTEGDFFEPMLPRKRRERGIVSALAGQAMPNFARTGRPNFGPGSNVNVIVVGFSLPNIFDLGAVTFESIRVFLLIISFFNDGFKGSKPFLAFWKDQHPFMKRLNRFLGKVSSRKPYDYYDQKPTVDEEKKVTKPGEPVEYYVNAGLTSEDPDFYGLTMRNFLGPFFNGMDKLEGIVATFIRNFKSSLSKELDNLLDNIEEFIDDLEDFLGILDAIISFFETLKTMGLYTLQFTSNGGNEDIVEKLLAAEGFPGVEEGDRLRLIGGMVFVYGTANPTPANIDFSGLVKEKMAIINYEAALAKFESSGDANDDPGSVESFLISEGIGTNYTSSLDKIFKKLF